MKEGWSVKTLGEISVMMADGPFGSNLKKEHYTEDHEVRIIQLSNIGEDGWREENTKYTTFKHLETIKRSEVFPDDIVIAKMMPAGRAIVCPNHERKYVLSSDAVKVQLKNGYDVRFILHSINSPYFKKQVLDNVSGSGRVRTSLTKLKDCKLRIPPLEEQQRISRIIDDAFAKIEALRLNAINNLSNASVLFYATLNNAYSLKECWKEYRLNELFNFIDYRGATPTKIKSGIPLVTAKNIKKGFLDYTIADFISEDEYNHRQSRGVSHKGDILFTTEAPLGNVAIADKDVFSAGQRVITFQQYPNSPLRINNQFYLYYFMSQRFQSELKRQATGLTAQGIKASRLKEIVVPYTSIDEQAEIVSIIHRLEERCNGLQDNCTRILNLCSDLKQALLNKAFNGDI